MIRRNRMIAAVIATHPYSSSITQPGTAPHAPANARTCQLTSAEQMPRVPPRLPPAPRRECEPASSRGVRVRPAEISPLQLAQMPEPQRYASGAPVRQRTPAAATRQQYQCDRFPQLQWPTRGYRRTPEPSALPAGYNARHRATGKQSRVRKPQMLLSVQRWTHESRSLRGKKAALLLDMGSVDPGCSSCGFQGYAAL